MSTSPAAANTSTDDLSVRSASTPSRKARERAARNEGQWALGQTEPLNPNEAFKQEDNGLNVRQRVEEVYSKEGFASIAPSDLHGRLRWWGLYTQRKPGIHGGRTGSMEPHELDDEYFLLRVRIDSGAVTTEQLRVLAHISTTYARDTADITDRQNIQYHWIRIEDMPEVWKLMEDNGLLSTEACGDTPRNVLGSPLAGIAADEIIDGTPAIREITRRFVGDPELSNLPRKFKTAISGNAFPDVAHEIHDVAFVGVNHPEHGPGFDVWVGGGLSTNPMLGQRLGAWVPLDEVADVWHGIIQLFRDYGYRRLRTRARIKFLVADWGPEKFRQVLQDEYLKRELLDGPAPDVTIRRDHMGVNAQKNGLFYVGLAPIVGRINGRILAGLAEAATAAGVTSVRFTPEQKVVLVDVTEAALPALLEATEKLGLTAKPSAFRRGTMACTGIEFCKLAITETKGVATDLVHEMERRFADVPELFADGNPPITINMNGCPNSCARAQIADIGLKGVQLPNPEDPQGETVDGFQISLGGGLGIQAGLGRKLRGLKTTAADLPDYVERVVRGWLREREDGETFNAWLARTEEENLR